MFAHLHFCYQFEHWHQSETWHSQGTPWSLQYAEECYPTGHSQRVLPLCLAASEGSTKWKRLNHNSKSGKYNHQTICIVLWSCPVYGTLVLFIKHFDWCTMPWYSLWDEWKLMKGKTYSMRTWRARDLPCCTANRRGVRLALSCRSMLPPLLSRNSIILPLLFALAICRGVWIFLLRLLISAPFSTSAWYVSSYEDAKIQGLACLNNY